MSFENLGLRVELLKAIKSLGYTTPTAIQSKAIPAILAGHDVMARAQTGTGKTDAFVLPLLQLMSQDNSKPRYLRMLVLTPTRELALQVGEAIKTYARRISLRCTVVYGGVRIEPQIERLRRGVDILVATPGRLLDLAERRYMDLSEIEFLVFDEADRMLDMGFSEEISKVLDLVPEKRKTMLFSATYTKQIRALADRMLYKPKHIEVTPKRTAAESVTQKVHLVEKHKKLYLLVHLIKSGGWSRVLVFCRTKHGANKLVDKLSAKGISAAALHGNKSQSFRNRTLKEFKEGEIHTLVATDVAARGLDINDLPYVVNYDTPIIPQDYVHRIGRTGRAGDSGVAVSLVSLDEQFHLQAIEHLLKQKIPVEKVDGFTEDGDVPDFVLYRPDSPTSNKKVDKDIKKLLEKRKLDKKRGNKPKKARRKKSSNTQEWTGEKKSRAKMRAPKSSKQGKNWRKK